MSSISELLDQWFRKGSYELMKYLVTPEGYLLVIAIFTAIGCVAAIVLAKRRRPYPY